MSMNAYRRNAIKGKLAEMEKDIIKFSTKKKRTTLKLSTIVSVNIKIKIAYVLCSLKIIRKRDYLRYVKCYLTLSC